MATFLDTKTCLPAQVLLPSSRCHTLFVYSCMKIHSMAIQIEPSREEVIALLNAWGQALTSIGAAYEQGKDFRQQAKQYLLDLYDFEEGIVFFKPTLAFGKHTFRTSLQGALSYFVGGDDAFPEDSGFALRPWRDVHFQLVEGPAQGIQLHGSVAVAMGHFWFTDKEQNQIMVEKTMVVRKRSDGQLRIVAHMSALPYQPKA